MKVRRSFDFHIHTRASDGAHEPLEVLRRAAAAGIDGISITDHDTIDAYDSLPQGPLAPRVLPGVELSTRLGENEAHILGYFPAGIPGAAREYVEGLLSQRRGRISEGVDKLRERGLDISWSDCERQATGRVVSRSHLALALVEKRYIGRAHRAYPDFAGPKVVPLPGEPAESAIRRLRELGAVPVWAHPSAEQIEAHLDRLVEAGLEGVEVHIPRRPPPQRRALAEAVRARGLLVTGGSDWHGHPCGKGAARPRLELGRFRVGEESVGELLERIGW